MADKPERPSKVNAGLPPLENDEAWSWFEFLPLWFFYLPVVFYSVFLGLRYRCLSLPLLANPTIPLAGMIGESKAQVLAQAGPHARKMILPFVTWTYKGETAEAKQALSLAEEAGLPLPLVVKPDLGCRGLAVRVLRSEQDLCDYLGGFPKGQCFLLQQLAPWRAEAGVFYVRRPGEARGSIPSLTLKYFPSVVGDGQRDLQSLLQDNARTRKLSGVYLSKPGMDGSHVLKKDEELALTFAGSHCRGSIFRDGRDYISKELCLAIDTIMQDFPEFYYGRLDIKFRDIAALQAGEDFCVIEINGASSEATHIWDARCSIRDVFVTLFWQYRSLYEIGHVLRRQGRQPPPLGELVRVWLANRGQSQHYPRGH